jgi:hypothetical protein
LLPPDVKAASDALAEILDRREQAGEAVDAARDAVEAARREDSDAAILAADNGKPAPKPTLPKAEERLAAAQRDSEALKVLVGRRQDAFLAVVRDAHGPLRAALAAELGEVAEELSAALDRCQEDLLRAAKLKQARGQLGRTTEALEGRAVNFMPPVPPGRRRREANRDPLPAELRSALAALGEWAIPNES